MLASLTNEFDLIKEQRCTLLEIDETIIKEFSREPIIICNEDSFESLNPGEEIDDNVCDLCLKWWADTYKIQEQIYSDRTLMMCTILCTGLHAQGKMFFHLG